jgi:excisionase family DNA binding protein
MTRHAARTQTWRRLSAAFLLLGLLIGHATLARAAPAAPDVLTLSEAAVLLRVEANELEQLASRSEVPARRIGTEWRFNRDALFAWLNGDWHLIAAIAPPDAPTRQPSVGAAEPGQAMAGLPLTASDLARTTGAGMSAAQAPAAPTESPPLSNAAAPIGEAPEDRTAEEVFLRGQKVLLAQGEVAVDIGQFYSRNDNTQLAVVGNAVGLANVNQSAFTTLLVGRVGIFNETELFVSSIFRSQRSDVLASGIKVAESRLSEFGDVRIGVRRTLITEGPGRANLIATVAGHIPTGSTSYAVGGGLALVKSFDPVVLFASTNYRHTFSRDFADITRLEPERRLDITLGYALALNDTLTISTAVSGLFSGETRFDNATLLRQESYSLQLGLTSYLARGLYIEPTVSFGLSGPGNSVAFGVTLPYTF